MGWSALKQARWLLAMLAWLPDTAAAEPAQSAVLVNGVSKQPATGFIIGWKYPTLFLLTARHAVIEDRNGKNIHAETSEVLFDASVCAEKLKAKTVADSAATDSAVLSVDVQSHGCKAGFSQLPPLRSSTWTAPTAPRGAKLTVLGRASGTDLSPRSVVLKDWNGLRISLEPDTAEEMSGGLLITHDGYVVGLISSTDSSDAYAIDFAAIITDTNYKKVPFNLAGSYSYVDLKGYPAGSRLTIDGDRAGSIDLMDSPHRANLLPGPRQLKVEAAGYDAAEGKVILNNPGSAVRCVKLVRRFDRVVARLKWPLLGAAAVAGTISAYFSVSARAAKEDFATNPTRAKHDDANLNEDLSRGFLIGSGGVAALALAAFANDRFSLSPRRSSTMRECE